MGVLLSTRFLGGIAGLFVGLNLGGLLMALIAGVAGYWLGGELAAASSADNMAIDYIGGGPL